MKKSILILFVLLSQWCLGQSINGTGMTLENKGIFIKDYPNYIMKTVEYYQEQDSIILSLKNRLDSLEADYNRIMYKLILNEVEKHKK